MNTNNADDDDVVVIRRADRYVLLHSIDNNADENKEVSFSDDDIYRLKQSFQHALPSKRRWYEIVDKEDIFVLSVYADVFVFILADYADLALASKQYDTFFRNIFDNNPDQSCRVVSLTVFKYGTHVRKYINEADKHRFIHFRLYDSDGKCRQYVLLSIQC